MQNFEDGDYRTAMRDFDSFLAANPRDARAGKAKVLRSFANVRQYVTAEGGTWSSALEAANEMVEQVGPLPAFRDEQVNLAELIIKIGEGLADRARLGADAEGPGRGGNGRWLARRGRRRAGPVVFEQVAAAVQADRGAGRREEGAGPCGGACQDGPGDQGLRTVAGLRRARRSGRAVPRPRPRQGPGHADDGGQRADSQGGHGREDASAGRAVGPCRGAGTADSPGAAHGSRNDRGAAGRRRIVYALADGYAYALHGLTGAPLWSRPLGLAAPFVPQPVPGDGTVVAIDARHNELVRLDAQTGGLQVAAMAGRAAADPPLVLGNQLAQVLPERKAAAGRARVGRAGDDRQPGTAAGPLAGQRRVRPAPLHSGPAGLPVRAGARAACRASAVDVSRTCRRVRSRVLRRDWAGS